MSDSLEIGYSYLRFSSTSQADGDSIRRQESLRDSWLRRNPRVRLDSTLTLADYGVSGYTGEHRLNRKHALAMFLELVEAGQVVKGAYLIVENLDRLTREDPVESIPAVMSLIKCGIRVVQLAPVEIIYARGMDPSKIMLMLMELCRGHEESKRKSNLCGEAWAEKKRAARAGVPHGKSVPAWLELANGKYRVRQDAARAIRLIFKWAAAGQSTIAITRRLTADGVPAFGRTGRWVRSYVNLILFSRSTLGEYQPMRGTKKRVADGEPISGYFPAVITPAQWHAAHSGRRSRATRDCRAIAPRYYNPFAGLLRCARHNCAVYAIERKGRRYLLSSLSFEKPKEYPWRPFPLDVFTAAVLSRLSELQATDLFADPGAGLVADVRGRLAEVELRLAVARERFEADPESRTWQDLVSQYDRERRAVVVELAEAEQAAASPLSGAWADAVHLMARNDPNRLRAALNRTIDEIRVLFVKLQRGRAAAAQIYFRGGAVRNVFVHWTPSIRLPRCRVPDKVRVGSAAFPRLDAEKINMRTPVGTRRMEELISGLGDECYGEMILLPFGMPKLG